jgi:iron complex outermembrane recepter protein
MLTVMADKSYGQVEDSTLSFSQLKKMSLEELMNIEVTSVSKHPEKLTQAASAIQVITQEDIRNSGAKTIPEALRLASNLQVAQVNSSQWAISARGFDNVLANRLLVLIDGRSVYTPLYAGVFWDVQNLVLEDVDRIEVISGPGGTLWGANAVNGVINIITKSAADTKGLFVEGATGNDFPGLGSIRYGGQINDNLSYRVYGTGFKLGNTIDTNGRTTNDQWPMIQGGFRIDWNTSKDDQLMLQTNIYNGKPDPNAVDTPVATNGDNIIVRWNHKTSEKSDFQLQAYYDRTYRDFGSGLSEDLKTYDIEWQNKYRIGEHHTLTYGTDLRSMDDSVTNLKLLGFFPGHKMLYLYSLFVQDEILLIKDRLHFTAGLKDEHNSYTGFEYQPNGRLAWTLSTKQTIWAAVSRAVRTPSRIDRDFAIYLTPTLPPYLKGDSSFISETVIAYELGWRIEPLKNLSVSLATFYNVYDDIRSAEPGPPPLHIPITIGNDVRGNTYGFELSATYQLTNWWNLRGGYTFLRKDLSVKPGTVDLNGATAESDDPESQVLIQSNINLPYRIELGTVVRYVDKLPKPYVPAYTGLDLRIGWKLSKVVELNIVGQNLLDKQRLEFIPSSPARQQIERIVYGKITCRF